MAGHSKWANIKHRKARADQKRGKGFSRLIREITVAASLGGPIVEDNPRLRAAVGKASSSNVPKETIQRAIRKGAGQKDGENFERVVYEGYGPGGIAILVETLTDNRNRTVAAVRQCFSKHKGKQATAGSVAYLFEQKGQIRLLGEDPDSIMEIALESGAEDVIDYEDGTFEVLTDAGDLPAVRDALVEQGMQPTEASVAMIPATSVEPELADARQAIHLLEALMEAEDVENVFSNGSFPDTLLND